MADEIVYRLLQGEGVQITENASTKTVEISVPSLSSKLNVGDVVQATQVQAGIIEIATDTEVRAGTDPDRAVTPAGLAAAAQANAWDATAGRLLRVGAFGIGGVSVDLVAPNLNDERPSGLYYCASPVNGPGGDGWLFHQDQSTTGFAAQTYTNVQGREWFRANNNGTWTAWREIYHTGNFDPATKANTSGTYLGLTVGEAATVGGQTAVMLAPPGQVAMFATQSAPAGWLKANGAAVSRTTYAALFAAISTSWGAGNGSTTFNLPDLRGEFLRALDDGRGVDAGRTLGSPQDSQNLSHGHTASQDGSHSHGGETAGVGDHTHTEANYSLTVGQNTRAPSVFTAATTPNGTSSSNPAGSHQHAIYADGSHQHFIYASGGGESRPRNVALLACIKY